MRSTVSYMSPETDTPEIYLFEPPAGVPKQYPTIGCEVEIEDGRDNADAFTLAEQGFIFTKHTEGVIEDFYDEAMVRDVYYAKVVDLVRRETGASDVVVFDHTFRSSRELRPGESDANAPVLNVHSDYTNVSGPARAKDVVGDRHAAAIAAQRYRIINVWRPVNGTVEQKPLALCDISSMDADDFVAAKIRFPTGRNGGVMAVRHSDRHRWVYFSKMSVEEVLLFQSFDPRATGAHRFGVHCAVDDPDAPRDARVRESIEVRVVALFDR